MFRKSRSSSATNKTTSKHSTHRTPRYTRINLQITHIHHNGLPRQRQHRRLQDVRRRKARPSTIRRQRDTKGAHPTMYESTIPLPSLVSFFSSSPEVVESMRHLLIKVIAIHSLTDVCFRKCITGKISAGKLDRSEEPCMQNCVDRFMDANLVVIKNLEQMRTHM